MLLGPCSTPARDEEFMRRSILAVAPERTSLVPVRVQRGSPVGQPRARRGRRLHHAARAARRGVHHQRRKPAARGKRHAIEVFSRLGAAEAAVHGVRSTRCTSTRSGRSTRSPTSSGCAPASSTWAWPRSTARPSRSGRGTVKTGHGELSVPPPAVVNLLRGVPTYAGPAKTELCTPTGAALLAHWVTTWGNQPMMTVDQIGTGCGTKDFGTHANVVRIFIGVPHEASHGPGAVLYETNVDDLDPRLWPEILQRLLDCGASDAWLTPILMKKGRPAYTLSVLLKAAAAVDVRNVIFAETSAIGLREMYVGKHALDRQMEKVEVEGRSIAVKVAVDGGHVVNVQPEYEDVAAAAKALDRPVKSVMADAVAAAAEFWQR